MSDPAVEAADRAAEEGRLTPGLMIPSESSLEFGVLAAREVLTPLRELHHPVEGLSGLGGTTTVCAHCLFTVVYGTRYHQSWPCATARLAYPSEEL